MPTLVFNIDLENYVLNIFVRAALMKGVGLQGVLYSMNSSALNERVGL